MGVPWRITDETTDPRREEMLMINKGLKGSLILAGTALLVASAACRTPELRRSGYLSDYSKLQEVDSDRLAYLNPRVQPGTYNGFIVEKIAINLSEDREGAFTAEELEELAEYTFAEITKRISEKERLVSRAGPGVARLRIALTDIRTSRPLLNVIPQTRMTGVGRGGAAFEAELVDSQTDQQIFATVRRTKPGAFEGSGLSKMADAKTVISQWCDHAGKNIRSWREGGDVDAME